jgi:hypothetical protein
MTDSREVVKVLKALTQAFPQQKVSRDTLEIYLRMLEDIPIDLLWRAAERHMAEAQYFPRIAELRGMAARLAGTDRFASLPPASPPAPDGLAQRALELEDDFYFERELDPQAWLDLADAFERADRPHRAEYTRKKLAALQAVLEGEAHAQPIGLHSPAEYPPG